MRKRWIGVILWMLLIFLLSNESGVNSTKTSEIFVNPFRFFESLGIPIEVITWLIRKGAHFFLYFVLGILVSHAVSHQKNAFLISLLLCLLYACSDELHQLLVAGRSGEIKDVIVDFMGSYIGVYLVFFLQRAHSRNSKGWNDSHGV